jgi:rubrerythrin
MSNLEELLMEAMNGEIEAKKFYLDASIKAQSEMGKKLFEELAEFEQKHFEHVEKIIESLSNNLGFQDANYVHDVPSVKSEVEGEIEPNKYEIVSVLALAIEGEIKAQVRYKKIADMFDNEEGKKIFHDLAQDERNHQRILEDEIYHLSNKGTIIWE